MSKPCILIHYDEVGLKGKNRPFFEKRLTLNIERSIVGATPACRQAGHELPEARRIRGRIIIEYSPITNYQSPITNSLKERLKGVFGIAYFAFAHQIPPLRKGEPKGDLSKGENGILRSLKEEILKEVEKKSFSSFAVITRRSNKNFPLNSQEVNRIIGKEVQDRTNTKVDLDHPELPIHIEILDKEILFYFEKISGPGGLPVGVSGKVASLLSGGIDSPVAAYQMMKRGCECSFIHFHSAPFTSIASQEKVKEVIEILTRHQFNSRLYLIPFAELQQEITTKTPPPYRVILYRRFMVRIAEEVAKREGALALVTGESMGQVASQTLSNMTTIESATTLPILRPLIGLNKQEIIRLAKEIGTYEISIEPHDDCCSYLMPREPVTHSTPEELEEIERGMDVKGWVEETLSRTTSQEFQFPTL